MTTEEKRFITIDMHPPPGTHVPLVPFETPQVEAGGLMFFFLFLTDRRPISVSIVTCPLRTNPRQTLMWLTYLGLFLGSIYTLGLVRL